MKILSLYLNKKSKYFQTFSVICILGILSYFIIFSKSNYKIMLNIVDIFINIIIPSLFPFILFSNILIYSNYFTLLASSKFSKVLQRVFKVSKYSASAIIFGFLFGYPNGARYVNELYNDGKISFKEAEYLLLFINNSSPAFVISSIGIGMFGNIKIGILLLVSHILASIFVGIVFRYKYSRTNKLLNDEDFNKIDYNLNFDIIAKSIIKSIYTICMVFGFMVIFTLASNIILKILYIGGSENKNISAFVTSLMELTSGIKKITTLNINLKTLIVLISFLLGFSSLSISFQIFSCVYNNKFKLTNIIKGKLLHGIFSSIISYVLVSMPKIYEYINISKSASHNIDNYMYINILNNHILVSFFIFIIHLLLFLLITKKKRRSIVSLKGG